MNDNLSNILRDQIPTFYNDIHFECGDGWFGILYDLGRKIAAIDPTCECIQAKEKFGGLRVYWQFNLLYKDQKSKYESIEKLVSEAETLSYTVCEFTGQPGKLRDDLGWWKTLCDEEYKKMVE